MVTMNKLQRGTRGGVAEYTNFLDNVRAANEDLAPLFMLNELQIWRRVKFYIARVAS